MILSFLYSLVWLLLCNHFMCRVSLLRVITLNTARTHTQTHTHPQARTVGRRDLYLETLNTNKRQTDIQISPAGYEPAILVVDG